MDVLLLSSVAITVLFSGLAYILGKQGSIWSVIVPCVVMAIGLLTIVAAFIAGISDGIGIALGVIGGAIFFSSFLPFFIALAFFSSRNLYNERK
ncbi:MULTISPECIES: hypothetical protein [Pontibacillus]|uniref:YesK-like protein n=1 Tax=Pontibacillus chungwhensis TaxID=265426 RepID=A0ABY8UZ32_9BACI|nr:MULTISPECIES: hypothetical protein [Pontibacillus]MCD5325736.1 hypothetical protein [Pontibacillus sp. HN14]WIF98026.1 hypothetical protein QNI29_20245 [Pontibacillus chungwhensis]